MRLGIDGHIDKRNEKTQEFQKTAHSKNEEGQLLESAHLRQRSWLPTLTVPTSAKQENGEGVHTKIYEADHPNCPREP